ncbi:MAG: hypothetical protein GY862_32500 [Gammaproteobacteria bacterium]|nr:hypothetical protein [Gammaproteobacteria bacterium]
MKIVLCNPEVRQNYSHYRRGMYPPLGLMALATYLEKKHQGRFDIQIIDGDVETVKQEMFKGADLIGFHTNSFNYENCLDFAQEAKEYGAKIIFGGPHASVLWNNILKNRAYVDFIAVEEAEPSPYWQSNSLIKGKLVSMISPI